MKKSIILAAAILATNIVNAQETILFENAGLKVEKPAKILKTSPDFNSLFTAKQNLQQYNATPTSYVNASKTSTAAPTNTIAVDSWGKILAVETGLAENYAIKYKFGTGANLTFSFMDNNFKETKSFNASLPTTANKVAIITTMSKAEDGRRIMMFVHYFEGGVGPAFQKSAVWVFNENGVKLKELPVNSAKYIRTASGETRIFGAYDGEENNEFRLYDANFNEMKSVPVAAKLSTNYAGSPVSFLKIKGQDKIVLAHYEKLFMNQQTYEVTPDNHLLVKIYDTDFNLEKTIPLDLTSIYPESPYIFALGDFGTLPFNYKFEITDKTFNDDDDLEIMYTIRYEDVINDKSWANYYVANEQGRRIRSLEKKIISVGEMAPIAGKDDQLAFIIGEGDFGSSIDTFDLQSWKDGFSFPAKYNDQILSTNFNRIPSTNGYDYLIGLGSGKQIDNVAYGLVNQYFKDGEFKKEIKLNIGTNPQMFVPILNGETLDPHVYNSDDDYEFTYIHKHKFPTGSKMYNEFSISKDYQTPIFALKGDGSYGDIVSSGFLRDEHEKAILKLAMLYQNTASVTTTEFYDVPFSTLATNDVKKSEAKIYFDDKTKSIGTLDKADKFEVYNAVGNLVINQSNTKIVSAANLSKGLYVVKLTINGQVTTSKVIVK
ncbi:T9SS type A sorting domain-containing protein [Soonwooa sp.]|uniref:T9SS type A sorting domain-containing protein n=1 Tax=Soonwooa sp. TaxID=1938592 RepID=UPI0026195399|nr:T9SS type A sorting domain-containing protein [Soonwooa sp.]